MRHLHVLAAAVALVSSAALAQSQPQSRPQAKPSRVALQRDEAAHTLTVLVEGRDVLTYQHGPGYAIPHYWPLRSPSGKLLTVQHPDPFPHHRSLWIVDRVQLQGGPDVDFYHCWKNLVDAEKPEAGYRHFIRHVQFDKVEAKGDRATVASTLRWIVDEKVPVLDEARTVNVRALGSREYLVELSWQLTATYGDVKFLSDWVHYAWPFIRMHPQFSGDQGGTLIDDQGRKGQKATNGKYAQWIDYSNTVDGVTEGLAVYVFPDGGKHKWLTREYGTFGPRRDDAHSGTKFTLEKGQSLTGRVGLLVHRGDVESGRVAERLMR